jgi:hypothetical protein
MSARKRTLAWLAVPVLVLAGPRLTFGQLPDPSPVPFPQPAESAGPAPGPPPSDSAPPATPPVNPDQPVKRDNPADGWSSPAAGGLSPLFGPTVGQLVPRADYRAAWFPEERVVGQGTRLGFVQQDFSLVCPLGQDACNDLSGTIHLRNELFQGEAIFPETGRPFPEDLWNIRFGLNYRHLFDNDWSAGGSVTVGSASDKPFRTINEITAGVNAFLRIPQGEHNAWLFTLSYSNTSQLPFPIPGIAFLWQPSDQFRANLGLPFQIMYRPVEDLTLDLSYMLLTTIHARATYRLMPWLHIYGGYDWNNEAYLLSDRTDLNDRLFYYDQRVTAGVQWILCKNASLDLSAGYTFDRYYFIGQSFSDRNNNRIDVGDGPFVAFQLRARW